VATNHQTCRTIRDSCRVSPFHFTGHIEVSCWTEWSH
jgi:hypothetical protein